MKEKDFLLEIYSEKNTERAQIIVKMLDDLWSIKSRPNIEIDTLVKCREEPPADLTQISYLSLEALSRRQANE